jgi:hypothetical protein
MYFSITVMVWVIFTTILTIILIKQSKWKLNNPDWAEIAANEYVEEKRSKRDRRKRFEVDRQPERRKTLRTKV